MFVLEYKLVLDKKYSIKQTCDKGWMKQTKKELMKIKEQRKIRLLTETNNGRKEE